MAVRRVSADLGRQTGLAWSSVVSGWMVDTSKVTEGEVAMTFGPCCTGGECCAPGSYCCKNAGPHEHPEIEEKITMGDATRARADQEINVEILYDPDQETFVEFESVEGEYAYRVFFGPETRQMPSDALKSLDFVCALRTLATGEPLEGMEGENDGG